MATNEIGITEQEFLQAAKLLEDDNLVWSADLDTIRKELAQYLREMAEKGAISNSHLSQVVRRFIAD
jgi:hypothetical protein